MPLITDKFGRASIVTDVAIATTVKTTRAAGVNVLEAIDLSKYSTDTPVFVVTYGKSTDPVTGVVTITKLRSWKALVNTGANTLTNLTIAPGYVDDIGNAVGDFIECIPTTYWENSLIDGIRTSLNDDGTLKTTAVNTALDTILDGGMNATLANQLSYQNLLVNGGCMVAQRGVPNISTTYQFGKVDRFAAKATGTAVSAGTITQLTSSLLAATKGYDLQIAGLTVTGTGIAFLRYRVEARDAVAFVNAIASFSCRVYHNVGSSVNYTIFINKPTVADNFTAVTAIANSGAISVPNATPTVLKFENINAGNLGDVSKGLEIEIQIACGAVTTKDFNFAEFMFNKGAKAGTFVLKPFRDELRDCMRYYEKSYQYGIAPGTSIGEDYTQMSSARVIATTPYRQEIAYKVPKAKVPVFTVYSANGTAGNVSYGVAGSSFNVAGVPAINTNGSASLNGTDRAFVGSVVTYNPDNLGACAWSSDAEL